MRITNNIILHNTSININGNKGNVDTLNNQMTSQKKIQRPSDDPVTAIRALRLRSTLSEEHSGCRVMVRCNRDCDHQYAGSDQDDPYPV